MPGPTANPLGQRVGHGAVARQRTEIADEGALHQPLGGLRPGRDRPEEQRRVGAADVGFIGQNVYLYCASEGLACVFRASLDAERLAHTLKLAESRFIGFAQTVGYPKG